MVATVDPASDIPVLARVNDTLTLVRAKHGPNWTPVTTSSHGVSHAGLTHLAPTEGTGEERWLPPISTACTDIPSPLPPA